MRFYNGPKLGMLLIGWSYIIHGTRPVIFSKRITYIYLIYKL